MGRWTAKSGNAGKSLVADGASVTQDVQQQQQPQQQPQQRTVQMGYGGGNLQSDSAPAFSPDDIALETKAFLLNCSLSEEQQRLWTALSAAVLASMPCPGEAKACAPAPSVLAALKHARAERDSFIAGLEAAQKEDVKLLLDLEKRQRKVLSRAEADSFKTDRDNGVMVDNNTRSSNVELKDQQKKVMARAFGLFEQDRQKQDGTNLIDSTEWKLLRARGGDDPTLAHYLKRAGWDKSWPMPAPEGRLLRREGQDAAIARYSRR